MVFGKTIVLPGEFFEPSSQTPTDPSEFLLRLRETFRTLKPTPASCHSSTSCFVHTALKTCSHVFNLGGRTGKILRPSSVALKSKNQEINRLQLAVKLPWAIFFESVDILS
ncbi:gag-Pol polyprotein [Trichonephila clavipes]|nr:gag-Pol polyprotein [Trichonephila clavipes]